MKMSDMRAKARAIFGPAIAEPMPKQPNGAKALQERANARPIPTYKVGGAVKKNTPPQPTAAEREADRKRREEYAKMKVSKEQGAAITRGNRAADIEGGRYKDGGKIGKYKQGSAVTTGSSGERSEPIQNLNYNLLSGSGSGSSRGGSTGIRMTPTGISQPSSPTAAMAGQGPPKGYGFKVTRKFKKGGDVHTSSDTARKLATEMGGMKKGGKAKKDGLAVMIAIGSPMKGMKKPVKKMGGGMAYAKGGMACAKDGGEMMKPVKRAQGGVGKVRKGMMTPEGNIVDAMNKVRGK
jgi:hypothetical protein